MLFCILLYCISLLGCVCVLVTQLGCVCVCEPLSSVWLTTPRTVACQAPLSVEFYRKEWVGCQFLHQRIFPTLGSNLGLLHWQADSFTTTPLGWNNNNRKHLVFPMDQAVFILSAFLCLNVLTPDAALWVGTRVIPTFQMRELNILIPDS